MLRDFRNFSILFLILLGASAVASSFCLEVLNIRSKAIESKLNASMAENQILSDASSKKEVKIIFVGDVMLSRSVGSIMEKRNDFNFPFINSRDFLNSADLTFFNLEGPISQKGKNQGSIYSFRANPRVMEGIVYSGVDVVSLANNHAFDWGTEALADTFSFLKNESVAYIGAGSDFDDANNLKVTNKNGIKVGFLGYTNLYPDSFGATVNGPGMSDFDLAESKLKEAKKNKVADILVVSLHWGKEYEVVSDNQQKEIAHRLIDAGADLIIGHHPHVAQDFEKYKDGYVFYSLGNFIFDQNFSKETMEGLAVGITVNSNGIYRVDLYKSKMNELFQPTTVFWKNI